VKSYHNKPHFVGLFDSNMKLRSRVLGLHSLELAGTLCRGRSALKTTIPSLCGRGSVYVLEEIRRSTGVWDLGRNRKAISVPEVKIQPHLAEGCGRGWGGLRGERGTVGGATRR